MALKAGTGIIITGDERLDRRLAAFDVKVQKKALRKATREAAKIVQADAKRLVPIDTGELERSLKVRAMRRSRNRQGHGVFTGEGFFKGDQFYGGFIELGTRRQAADPFLRPALFGNQAETLRTFRIALAAAINSA